MMSERVSEDAVHKENFLGTLLPFMFACMFVELLVSYFKGKKLYRVDDTINSISHGILEQLLFSLTSKGIEFSAYLSIWNDRALFRMPVDSILVWICCFLAVDMGYYWFHRMAHEINFLWATHQVHHSSEEMNLSTAFRQGVFQVYFSWVFYLPLAFFIHPHMYYVHKQFNTLYQFFIHTRTIKSLGPLEYVLNCPSHHRVHHGRNRPYIDKNYGGILIIWDRLFGTFADEIEEPAYGLVHPLAAWDVIQGQICHYQYMFWRFMQEKGVWNKLAVIWKGPGWNPGEPRLGLIENIPQVDPSQPKYGQPLSSYLSLYVCLHFTIVVLISFFLLTNRFHSQILHSFVMMFLVLSLQTFAAICDRKPHAAAMEISRVMLFLVSELICYLIYRDHFIFLWFKDSATDPLIPLIHRPVRVLRMIFVLSLLWIMGRAILVSESTSISEFVSNLPSLEPTQNLVGVKKEKSKQKAA